MKKFIIFLTCLIAMGCSKFDDPVRDLGYEITDEAINSYAEVDGVKIKATITPVVPVEGNVTEFYVLVSRFPENFEFTSDKHIVEDVAKQSEDDSFEYNTLLQKAEFIGENNLAIPCFYLQEQVYFKSVPKHLMPAPKISCVYETFTSEDLEDEVIDDKKYEVKQLTFYFKVFEDKTEKQMPATTSVKFYKPKSFIDITIDDSVEEIYDEIVIEF